MTRELCYHYCPICREVWSHIIIPVEMPKCDDKDYNLNCLMHEGIIK